MGELRDFCQHTSQGLVAGLERQLNIKAGYHFHPKAQNSLRVLSLHLYGIEPTYLPKIQGMQDVLPLWAGLSEKFKARVGHDGRSIIIEIPKPGKFWKKITVEDLLNRRLIRPGFKILTGLGLRDEPERVNFNDPSTAHIYIAGGTRSGKTTTQKVYAWSLCHNTQPEQARLFIFDVAKRGYKWSMFNGVNHLAYPVITDIKTAEAVLAWLIGEMGRRGEKRYVTPKIFVLIDELKALADESQLAVAYLSKLAAVGGEFGIHLILATQYPQVSMLGSAELKRNIMLRLCGKVDDAASAVNALGIKNSGAERLAGYGDFLIRRDDLARITVPLVEEQSIQALHRGHANHISLPEVDYTEPQVPSSSRRPPDEWKPEELGLAIFKPMAINRLQTELGIGGGKATRLKALADAVRTWALGNGYSCLES